MSYFDFHVHPTLKCMFSEADSKTSPWIDIDVKKIPWILRWCTEFAYILGSQADLGMVSKAKADLLCVAIFVPERGMTTNSLIMQQAKGTLHPYLNASRLEKINNETLKPYPDLVYEDMDVLFNAARFGVTGKEVVALNKGVVFNPDDATKTYVVFSVEGLHTLSPTMDKTKINITDILKNLDEIASKLPILSVNITHLEQYPFCNQAYGIQFVSDEDFKPTGNRISSDGIAIIKHCYEKNIMIDIKHESLAARRMLIEKIRSTDEFKNILQPLVCTHAGFTGLSYSDIPDYLTFQQQDQKNYLYLLWGKPKKYGMLDFMLAFNPSSINLFDEDIIAILQSGGMIGLSMDKRILGYSEADARTAALDDLAFEEEYISTAETDVYLTKPAAGSKITNFFCISTQEVLQGGEVNPDLAFYHLCHFMQHVLHFIKVAHDNNYDIDTALTQICIGSDFDGVINPVWCCPDVTGFDNLKKEFIKTFMSFAHANRKVVSLPDSFDVSKFADQLFFENWKNFVLKRLEKIYG